MSKRHKMSARQSRHNFSRGNRINRRNVPMGNPMRGGIRL